MTFIKQTCGNEKRKIAHQGNKKIIKEIYLLRTPEEDDVETDATDEGRLRDRVLSRD